MVKDLFLAVDIGTTNVKGAVFDKGSIFPLESISRRISLYTEEGKGVAEQDPDEILKAVIEVISFLARKYGGTSISTIFLTSQMHAFGILEDGRPKTRLLTYFDTRSGEYLSRLEPIGYELYTRTGCPPLHVYPLLKILYAKDRGLIKHSDKLLISAKDYIILKMTGLHVLDLSTASGSQLVNTHNLKWDELALEVTGVEENQLPELIEGSKKPLPIDQDFASKVDIPSSVEVFAGVSDASANQVGVGSISNDTVAINLGTSAAVRFLTENPVFDDSKMRFFLYYAGNKRYLAGGAVNNGGIVVDWFLKRLGQLESEYASYTGQSLYEVINTLATSSPPGANGVIALPFLLGGERFPIRRPEAKAVFYGLQFHNTKSDILRSLLEGVVFTLKMIYDALSQKGLKAKSVRVGGGGSSIPVWRQIIADVFQLPVFKMDIADSSLLGALIHYLESQNIHIELPHPSEVNEPSKANLEIYRARFEEFAKLVEHFYPS